MRFMNFSYNERKKSYFSDRHEDKNNKDDRKIFIKKNFNIEKRTYQWIQITEESAKKYERDEDEPLLKNSFYENTKMVLK